MARVIRVRPDVDPGVRRVRAGSGFRYIDPQGGAVEARAREDIDALAIPPAWTDVWICADPSGHIQAVGTDAAGRRQYIYHSQWQQRRSRGKFARALDLAEALPRARARVTRTLRAASTSAYPERETTLAVAFRMLDELAPRIGSSRYMERHGSRGLTTLVRRDARVGDETVALSFPGKSGQRAQLEVVDAELAAVLAALAAGRPGASLLWYRDGRRQRPLTPTEVNAYVRELTGGSFTAKDFRTLRGTIVAAQTLAELGNATTPRQRRSAHAEAARAAAAVLGNTPTVARNSYIDPRVFRRHGQGELLDLTVSPESALRRLLAEPRRRTPRRGRPRQQRSPKSRSSAREAKVATT